MSLGYCVWLGPELQISHAVWRWNLYAFKRNRLATWLASYEIEAPIWSLDWAKGHPLCIGDLQELRGKPEYFCFCSWVLNAKTLKEYLLKLPQRRCIKVEIQKIRVVWWGKRQEQGCASILVPPFWWSVLRFNTIKVFTTDGQQHLLLRQSPVCIRCLFNVRNFMPPCFCWCFPPSFTLFVWLAQYCRDNVSESMVYITPDQVSRWCDFRKEHVVSDSNVPLDTGGHMPCSWLTKDEVLTSHLMFGRSVTESGWAAVRTMVGKASNLPGTTLSTLTVLTKTLTPCEAGAVSLYRWGDWGMGKANKVSSDIRWVWWSQNLNPGSLDTESLLLIAVERWW